MARTEKVELHLPTKVQLQKRIVCTYWACPYMKVDFQVNGWMNVRTCEHPKRPKRGLDLLRWPYEFAPRECPRRTA